MQQTADVLERLLGQSNSRIRPDLDGNPVILLQSFVIHKFPAGDKPLKVECDFYVEDFGAIDEVNMVHNAFDFAV
jgi:hypothetical protein